MPISAIASKRITSGLYEVSVADRTFHVEDIVQASDGSVDVPGWMLYEINKRGEREFWNDFRTKRQAISAIVIEVNRSA